MDKSKVKIFVKEFENGNITFNYSYSFENETIARIIKFLEEFSNEITNRNLNYIKFNCVVNDFEFTHQLSFNLIYADTEESPSIIDNIKDTDFSNCNLDFHLDLRTCLFNQIRNSLMKIWDSTFKDLVNKENVQNEKNPYANFNLNEDDFLIYQEIAADNLDGFIAQTTDY